MEDSLLELGEEVKIKKVWSDKRPLKKDDLIPREQFLVIYLNSKKISALSCSPSSEIELAIGYLVTSGYLKDAKSIDSIRFCEDDNNSSLLRVLEVKADIEKAIPDKVSFISSGCGSIDDFILEAKLSRIKSDAIFYSSVILRLSIKASTNQRFKKEFGGLHSGVLFDENGEIIIQREDLGRHNCLDKIIGHSLLKDIDMSECIIYTTGRVSFDVVLKLASVNIPCLVTNSSVTEKAVKAAKKFDLTLIGYSRGKRFNIYNDGQRIRIDNKFS